MAFPSVEELNSLIDPVAREHGLDVEAVKVARAGAKSSVSIRMDADDRPDLDQLELVSQEISLLFDAAEERGEVNFGAGYTLEVSTPGVDMPLTAPRHWRRNRGRLVKLGDGGSHAFFRIGALDEDQTRVILVARKKKDVSVRVLELANAPRAVVEIEFAKVAAEETDLVQRSFEDAAALAGDADTLGEDK